jgi:hypothetical protein
MTVILRYAKISRLQLQQSYYPYKFSISVSLNSIARSFTKTFLIINQGQKILKF